MFCDLGPHNTGIKSSKNPSAFKAIFIVKQGVADKIYHLMQGLISGDVVVLCLHVPKERFTHLTKDCL